MRAYCYSLVLVLLIAPASSGQKKCELTIATSPTLQGFQLSAFSKYLNSDVIPFGKLDDSGWRDIMLWGRELNELESGLGKGVRFIEIGLLDEKVAAIELTYDDSEPWTGLADFRDKITATLNLPSAWDSGNNGRVPTSVMKCDGFEISVLWFTETGPTLRVTDTAARLERAERQKKAEEAKRQTLKP